MAWEEGEKERRWTRREWVKLGMTAGTLGALGALGGLVQGQLLPPPVQFGGEIRETLVYTKFPTPQWWNSKDGQPVRPTDFKNEWDGATAVWRGLFQNNELIPGTGFPVIVMRIKANAPEFTAPDPKDVPSLPEGFQLYYRDPEGDGGKGIQIVVCFDRCVHLCCYPGWHVVHSPPPGRDYIAPSPTYSAYGQDPIYCVCHGSQYDPLVLVQNVNPKNGAVYVGAAHVHGPANRALPIVPVALRGGVLTGGMPDPRWYVYC